MALALVLIVVGVVVWLLLSPLFGIILLAVGLALALFDAATWGRSRPSRYWY
jgi:hypothetical protein